MSNQLSRFVQYVDPGSPIPAIDAGTVPPAERYVIANRRPPGVAEDRFIQADDKVQERPEVDFFARVTDDGGHANFVATFEGSMDGVTWAALHYDADPTFDMGPPTFMFDQNGIGFTDDVALAGFVFRVNKRCPYYRIGLAGNAATSGAGQIGLVLGRSV